MGNAYSTDCDSYLLPVRPVEGAHVASEADIFGPQGRLAASRAEAVPVRTPRAEPLTGSYAYESVVVAVFILLCYLIHSYRSSLALVFRVQTMRLSVDKAFEEQNLFFRRFLRLTSLWGVLLVGGLLIRCASALGAEASIPQYSPLVCSLAGVAALAAVALVGLYRKVVTGLIGGITSNQAFFGMYRFMAGIFSAFAYFMLTPLFLAVALTPDGRSTPLLYGILGLAALLYIVYLTKSYRFFIGRNVSILQWILYLCTVEIFPVSFFVLAAVRNP